VVLVHVLHVEEPQAHHIGPGRPHLLPSIAVVMAVT
jgi:hypothetical protein